MKWAIGAALGFLIAGGHLLADDRKDSFNSGSNTFVNKDYTDRTMAIIAEDGTVTINWDAVETAAKSTTDNSGPLARVMIAIRDHSYKKWR